MVRSTIIGSRPPSIKVCSVAGGNVETYSFRGGLSVFEQRNLWTAPLPPRDADQPSLL